MSFSQYQYTRPDNQQIINGISQKLSKFKQASTATEQQQLIVEINEIRRQYSTMYNICMIRHTIDTNDAFYEAENQYFDEIGPEYKKINADFYRALVNSPFKKELSEKWGGHIFVIAELSLKTFEPAIMASLKKENELKSSYNKQKANAKILFQGKEYNISTIAPFLQDRDRNVRASAAKTVWNYFDKESAFNEQCFDDLVKTRHQMAKELGYENFVQLGYARMLRSDYTPKMVANFRKQILEEIVPLASELGERQRKRLGLTDLKFWDEGYKFKTGNAMPKGDASWIVARATKMYKELSPETNEFFGFMKEQNLMDLVSRDGKSPGGYCTFIDNHRAPYIFSNFNGTRGDIDVLTHEAGHAFQVYSSRNVPLMEYNWPTYEACEIHSMSMEFFTWPWMHLFFEEDVEKYFFSHLVGAIQFLPYGVAVDEFQHEVYEKPEMTPSERNACWKKIEEKYLPHRDYDGIPFLQNGGYWQKQSHIFASPFYYIDYTLAQICAFQFWVKDQINHDSAWKDYVDLCAQGGKFSFLELVNKANLDSPFESGVVKSLVGKIKEWLEKVDDSSF